MSETTVDIEKVFSSIAGRYEALNTILTLNIDKHWRKKAIRECNLKPNQKVLDLCCGTGQMVEYECKAVGKESEVIGLDLTEGMLQVAYNKLSESLKDYKFRLIKGNAMELPFNNNSFDRITIAFGLRNIPDKEKSLSEIYRVLKPGGKAVCLELSKPQMPVLRNIYNLYFNNVLPIVGYLGTKDKMAYKYLRDSVNGFMTKEQLKAAFINAGFKENGYISLTLGTAAIHFGMKV
jgi:demethylmenaquinone methyltransferase/2-methoxy-6-polyprenyl-1,4-benzoquinol methylase